MERSQGGEEVEEEGGRSLMEQALRVKGDWI